MFSFVPISDIGANRMPEPFRPLDYALARHHCTGPQGGAMRNLTRSLALLFFVTALTPIARAQTDDEAVRKLPQAFCDAWAKHDGHQLATIMAEDVDFVPSGFTAVAISRNTILAC
jgi:hypothetical protein